MKIAAICITYNRPQCLSRAIECFMRQTHPDRELVIVDDAWQYGHQFGDRWKIVSLPCRLRSIGELRNLSAALANNSADAYAIWDDDDVYLPDHLAAAARALEQSAWARPTQALEFADASRSTLLRYETFSQRNPAQIDYHGGWSFCRDAFVKIGGYPLAISEDHGFAARMTSAFGPSANTITPEFPVPQYIYDRFAAQRRGSECGMDQAAYEKRHVGDVEPIDKLVPYWDMDYAGMDIPPTLLRRKW